MTDSAQSSGDFTPEEFQFLAEQGIRQFLDIDDAPGSRVVYVDYDATVVSHARQLLEMVQ